MTVKTFGINLLLRFICLGIVLLLITACSSVNDRSFAGTVLSAAPEAIDFTLVDQFGETVRLSDYQNQVVVLTFVYTACNDICPVIAHHLKDTEKYLSYEPNEIAILLISVDPGSDTIKSTQQFLSDYGMLEKWKYLVGEEEALKAVWRAFYISTSIKEGDPVANDSNSKDALETQLLANYSVTHQGPVYLIDRTGHSRSVFTLPFEPEDLANDMKILLEEN